MWYQKSIRMAPPRDQGRGEEGNGNHSGGEGELHRPRVPRMAHKPQHIQLGPGEKPQQREGETLRKNNIMYYGLLRTLRTFITESTVLLHGNLLTLKTLGQIGPKNPSFWINWPNRDFYILDITDFLLQKHYGKLRYVMPPPRETPFVVGGATHVINSGNANDKWEQIFLYFQKIQSKIHAFAKPEIIYGQNP